MKEREIGNCLICNNTRVLVKSADIPICLKCYKTYDNKPQTHTTKVIDVKNKKSGICSKCGKLKFLVIETKAHTPITIDICYRCFCDPNISDKGFVRQKSVKNKKDFKDIGVTDNELKIEYEEGSNIKDLSIKYQCSKDLIRNHLKKVGYVVKSKGRPKGFKAGSETEIKRIKSLKETLNRPNYISPNKKDIGVPDDVLKREYEKTGNITAMAEKYNCGWGTIKTRLLDVGCILNRCAYPSGVKHHNYGRTVREETKRKISAAHQHLTLSEWEGYIHNKPYCDKFDNECRAHNREKYDNQCFVCGITKEENGNRALSVHHVSRNKMEGCDGSKWQLIPLCMSCHSKAHHEPLESRVNFLLND